MKTPRSGGTLAPTKLPIILGLLVVSSFLLLVLFSVNPPDGGASNHPKKLLRDSVRAAVRADKSTQQPDVLLSQTSFHRREEEEESEPPPPILPHDLDAPPASLLLSEERGSLRTEPPRQHEHRPEATTAPSTTVAAAVEVAEVKAKSKEKLHLHFAVPKSARNTPEALPLLRKHYVDALLSSRRQQAPTGKTEEKEEEEDVVKTLHRALQKGITTTPAAPLPSSPAREKDLSETLERMIRQRKYKSFIEISTLPLLSSFSHLLAETFPSLLTVFIPMKQRSTTTPAASSGQDDLPEDVPALSNLAVAKRKSEFSRPFPGMFDCIQLVEDLDRLVYTQLPFEFEETLGRVLCRCNATVVPRDLPKTTYFAFWENTAALLLASVVAAADICTIRFDVSASEYSKLRYSHVVATRNDNSTQLSTPTGHISAAHLVSLGLSTTSWQHLGASINDYCSLYGKCQDLSRSLSGLAVTGSMLTDSARGAELLSSTMRRLRLIHTLAGDDEEDRKPVAKPTYSSSSSSAVAPVPSNNTSLESTNNSSSYSRSASAGRRRLYSYTEVKSSTSSSSSSSSSENEKVESAWELSDLSSSEASSSLREFNDMRAPPNETKSSVAAKVSSVSREARLRQRSMQEREESCYHRWAAFVHEEDMLAEAAQQALAFLPSSASASTSKSSGSGSSPVTVYVIGRHITMLSSKLAQGLRASNTHGSVVALHTDYLSLQPHKELLELLGARNTLICSRRLSSALLGAMLSAPERAHVMVIQADVVFQLLTVALTRQGDADVAACGAAELEEMIAALLLFSRMTYFEMPDRHAFLQTVELVAPECEKVYSERYYLSSLASAEAPLGEVLLRAATARLPTGLVVDILEKSFIPADATEELPSVDLPAVFKITVDSTRDSATAAAAAAVSSSAVGILGRGVSVYTLLHLDIDTWQKRHLLQLYMELPLWSLSTAEAARVRPWSVFVRPHSTLQNSWALWYHSESVVGSRGGEPPRVGASQGHGDFPSDRSRAKYIFHAISQELRRHPSELAEGKFSFVEHGSGYGFFSALLASKFVNATILALEPDAAKVTQSVSMLDALGISNVAVCNVKADTETVLKNMVESPELFRFQLASHSVLDNFASSSSLEDWGLHVGTILSTALTSYLVMPPARQISLAMEVFFGDRPFRVSGVGGGDVANKVESSLLSLASHPTNKYKGLEALVLLSHARARSGSTQVALSNVMLDGGGLTPIVRCDVTNMTRHVHHHYDYAKDGHTRTYTMRVSINKTLTSELSATLGDVSATRATQLEDGIRLQSVRGSPLAGSSPFLLPLGAHPNQHEIVDVHLVRDKDAFPIPYITIYGVTLITALRLGLETSQRDRLFESFLRLPLFEDMAPWNVVLSGAKLDYIDYDTRDKVFDVDVPKAYRVMAVLMNYKRTVEDFHRCGRKAATVYGLPYVSDCVGRGSSSGGRASSSSSSSSTCPDLAQPVPCGDGNCHTDYISCLRALSSMAERLGSRSDGGKSHSLEVLLAEAMRSGSAAFDEKGLVDQESSSKE